MFQFWLRSVAKLALATLLLAAPPATASDVDTRRFTFVYETVIGPVPEGEGPVHVFVPLAVRSDQQRVVSEFVEASIPGSVETEDAHGNRYWHGELARSGGAPIEVRVRTTVERRVSRVAPPPSSQGISERERLELAAYLGPNDRVVIDHPILEPIQAELRPAVATGDAAVISRAIYDWVVDNVEYKKVGTGWGNGDTFWACNERYGNCTDFHALFISLARSEGIPSRFEIGFPVPDTRTEGSIGGYHCWVEFYLPEVGWFPIDASEAFKSPERRDFFYGAHPGDRIHLSTGRDLELGAGHATKPLNYFVYPHVEVAGDLFKGSTTRAFRYEESPASTD